MDAQKSNLYARLSNWEKQHPKETVIIATLALICIYYSGFRHTFDYWDGMIGNLAATLIGIIVGIPIAFEIERWRQSQEEAKQRTEKIKKAQTIVSLIRDELQMNLDRINDLLSKPRDSVFVSIITDEVWKALSNSGEIHWIDNPEILSEIAMAYYFSGIIAKMGNDAYDTHIGFNYRYARGQREAESLKDILRERAPDIAAKLHSTIEMLIRAYDLSLK